MKKIPLTRGKVALVDDEDYERLNRHKWQAISIKQKRGTAWYARRMTSLKDGPRKAIYMHRDVLRAPDGMPVDHRDFNGLNNQKKNIRVCSYSENGRRRRKSRGTRSRYKGVAYVKRSDIPDRHWQASIRWQGTTHTLGLFAHEKDAALMYNVAAQLFFGEFAYLNNV